MATTTPNFGWDIPQSTDLVKDGATAIAALGTDIDTALVDLKGGTTGQVLSKASNTDLDFSWVSDATGIQATIFDAKGDIIAATAADTASRLASSGVNGDLLTVDTSTATGLKWAAPTAAGANWSLLNTGGTTLTGAATITVSGISGKDKIMVLWQAASSANANSEIGIRLNGDTGNNYYRYGAKFKVTATYTPIDIFQRVDGSNSFVEAGTISDSQTDGVSGYFQITGCNSSGVKVFTSVGATSSGLNNGYDYWTGGYYNSSSTISSVSIRSSTGNFDNGTIWVYTSA